MKLAAIYSSIVFLAILYAIYGLHCTSKASVKDVVYTEKHYSRIGVMPEIGGRVVYLSLSGYQNIFKEDTSLWSSPRQNLPKQKITTFYTPFHGHVVWPAPMKNWWQNQNIYPEKKISGSRWPPDPYLEYGKNSLVTTRNGFILESPGSPVSGIKITKRISIIDEGILLFGAAAANIRDTVLPLALWLNTRFPGDSKCYIPLENTEDLHVRKTISPDRDPVPWSIYNGYFTFHPDSAKVTRTFATSKAYIYPEKPYMAAFNAGQVLVIIFPHHAKSAIHPDHALVEIFNQRSSILSEDLLELEYQSAYKDIPPGKQIKTSEVWVLLPYDGPNDIRAHTNFLLKNESAFLKTTAYLSY